MSPTTKKLKVIYEPKGKAREYAEYATNPFTGCDHACAYCFAPGVLHRTKNEFHQTVEPRKDFLKKLEADAAELERRCEKRDILLSFTCDIYSPGAQKYDTTTEALRILLEHGLNINILTKGGSRSLRDIEMLKKYKDQVRYGVSLVFAYDSDAAKFEPGAAPTSDRVDALYEFSKAGFVTWVSLEPVWSAWNALELIDSTSRATDYYRIGVLNYYPHAKEVDWSKTVKAIQEKVEAENIQHFFKDDTAKFL